MTDSQLLPLEDTQLRTVPVLVPTPAERAYSYAVPEDVAVQPGSIVQVPLGPRKVAAVVWDGETDEVDPAKLRPITQAFDCPPVTADMRRFVDWVAHYTLSAPGIVARMVLRVPAAFEPEPPVPGLRLGERRPERKTAARARLLDMAADGFSWTRSGLAHAAGVSLSVVDGLVRQEVFESVQIPPRPMVADPDPDHEGTALSAEQEQAAETLRDMVRSDQAAVSLLDGVTGSGKTEVYFEAIAEAVRRQRQVLILLPEIALTAAFLERFEQRFGSKPAEWHSDVPPRQREKVWRQVANGDIWVVAGARSSLFLPFAGLGLIVVDEEHDLAYKQEDRVFYNARDMAVVRGHLGSFPVVLASATPSIESRVNA